MDKNENIKKTTEELKQVSGDYELRRIAELREKYIRDEQAALDFAIEKGLKIGIEKGLKQGIEQGIEQGVKQEKIEIAKKLLKLNADLQTIIEATGLTKTEITDLNKGD